MEWRGLHWVALLLRVGAATARNVIQRCGLFRSGKYGPTNPPLANCFGYWHRLVCHRHDNVDVAFDLRLGVRLADICFGLPNVRAVISLCQRAAPGRRITQPALRFRAGVGSGQPVTFQQFETDIVNRHIGTPVDLGQP
jgi:hypothetical protein